MPELPEVECVKKSLSKHVNGKKIKGFIVRNPHLFWTINQEKLAKMTGSTVYEVTRRAKYILLRTDKGFLSIHLGMTGKVLRREKGYVPIQHDHLMFEFDDFILVYNDVRRFGYIEWMDDRTELNARFAHLGLEPCDQEFNSFYLSSTIKNKKKSIKEILMDSKIVVGIGNIYANEILFRARVDPERKSNTLKNNELQEICRETKITLAEAIQEGGSSLRDYVDVDGNKGRFQEKHLIYSRSGKPCYVCGTVISRIIQAGRASFICETCQK